MKEQIYDEFIEELTALIEPDYKKRFEEMYPSGLEKLNTKPKFEGLE